ncbi:hypothetical protein EK904_013989, partial [Melospiza melodia maxima]
QTEEPAAELPSSQGKAEMHKCQLKPELPKASDMHARPVPRTPGTTDERRKQLEEWLAAKGRTYKRPPMRLLQKQAVIPSCRKGKPTEKQEQHFRAQANSILTECLQLIEEGVHAEEISTVLSLVPQAEKFAKFWICQAKLLARSGPFDVLQLYREAVSAGAEPVEDLRETALNLLKDAGQKLEGNLSIVGLMSMGAPRCCQPGGHTVYSLSQHLVSLLRSVVKLWNPDLKNGTLFFCLG